jgi:hypothetical protein
MSAILMGPALPLIQATTVGKNAKIRTIRYTESRTGPMLMMNGIINETSKIGTTQVERVADLECGLAV